MEYSHPRPSLTTDAVVLRYQGGWLEVLLIKRGRSPHEGHWALPGGFVDENESPIDCARRELKEETAVSELPLYELGVFAEPGRDPRGWVASVAFLALAPADTQVRAGDDAREAMWFRLNQRPELAFDHGLIIERALESLKASTQFDTRALQLLPPGFRTKQARHLYSQIWGQAIKPTQFKAWLRRRGAVNRIGPARFQRADQLNGDWLR